ncbi:MAG: PKD domain-containing protein [Desulfobulbaceae bacterium]
MKNYGTFCYWLLVGVLLCPLPFPLGVRAADVAITAVSAAPERITEGAALPVALNAAVVGTPAGFAWTQIGGPKVVLTGDSATSATVDASALEVAAECALVFRLTLTDGNGATVSHDLTVPVQPLDMVPMLGDHVQIGGSSTAVARFTYGGDEWCLFNVGTALKATPVDLNAQPAQQLILPGFIQDVATLTYNGGTYALAALGGAGVALVDISDPAAMTVLNVAPVNYRLENVTYAEGGGSILYGNLIESVKAPIVAVATDGTHLFLADAEYGIHKTALSHLFNDAREADGTLLIDQERATVQYAGERPWGGAQALKLYGNRLFVPLDVLGLGIFDPATLEMVGRYNYYLDDQRGEDYFGHMIVREAVARDPATGKPYLDAMTGMPDYRQVNYEIRNSSKGKTKNTDLLHPWADLERQGRWYYQAIDVDVTLQNNRTIAYVAYSLAGVVAVDVTGIADATPTDSLQGNYLGYFPAVPANGPEDTGSQPASLLPYEGAGMLKEAGVRAVRVQGDTLFLTDHFAGLVLLGQATHPETWRGANAPYSNDSNTIPGDHVPDNENITSFDMAANDPLDNESLPSAFFQAPCQLATSELNGHGNTLALMDNITLDGAGAVDVLECSGGGGFVFVDLFNLQAPAMADRYAITGYYPPTDEVGAAPDGSPTQTISIGHTSGVAASTNYLYVSDGPHGVSAWKITDADGYPTDTVHLVGNTVQDEYPVTVSGETIYPPSHTVRSVIDPSGAYVWSLCARNGLRRVPVTAVEQGQGQVGAPLLLGLSLQDIYEHNNEVANVDELNFQDHAYDVEFLGDLAFVADGSNGLTVYDVSKDPTVADSGFFVANLGTVKTKPLFGTAHGVDLWVDPATGRRYAIIAAGPYGVGVAEVSDVLAMRTVKVFQPIKYEDGDVGTADGKASDVEIIGDKAYFTYDSFGVVCYAMSDLIAEVPEGVDPTELFKKSTRGVVSYDYRPEAIGRFKLQEVPGQEDVDGAATRLKYTLQEGRLQLYVAFGAAGLVKVDFTEPATPVLVDRVDTAAECADVAISNGRIYLGDGSGGLVFFK